MKVNGKEMELGNKQVVTDLIKELNLNAEKIVIEIDRKIVSKEDFEKYELKESNIIEVISFVGGG
jgi:sulfur carrier protein